MRTGFLSLFLMFLTCPAWSSSTVPTKHDPGDSKWKEREVRALPGDLAPVPLSRWGGRADRRSGKATGFFHTWKSPGGRWWFVDPDGHLFLHIAVAGIYDRDRDDTGPSRFASREEWAAFTRDLLVSKGFNGFGGWTDREAVGANPLPYTLSLNFVGEFARTLDLTKKATGHIGFVGDVPPVFHADFPEWCKRYAVRRLAAVAGDAALVGVFSDNELPFHADLLDKALTLDTTDPGLAPLHRHAEEWLSARGRLGKPTDEDRSAYLEAFSRHYFQSVHDALSTVLPNHLYLGCRFHGRILRNREVFRAARGLVDVVSVNVYNVWTPNPAQIASWNEDSGAPILITEFYAKGEDTGLSNTVGAGWLVPTQEDRGAFYRHFVLGLLDSPFVVGWHWFKYRDSAGTNQGIVNGAYTPYGPLLEAMREVNAMAYPLAERAKH